MKSQKGSTVLFVIINSMFFLAVLVALYVNSSNKIQKQEKEIQQIQAQYKIEDINLVYEETLIRSK